MSEKTLSQQEVNDLIGKVRIEARERARSEFDAELKAAKDEAEQANLVENQEYKELSERLQSQVTEQVGLVAQVEKYQEIMKSVLDSELEELSEAGKKAVESLPGDVEAKLEWLSQNKELFAKEVGDGVGTPASPVRKQDGNTSGFKFNSRI